MTIDIKSIIERKTQVNIKTPAMYKVIFYNDNITTFQFVTDVLEIIYNKTFEEAKFLAIEIDKNGKSIVAVYPKEIAQTKQILTISNAKKQNYPLRCEIEIE